jgi:hypothetical protein
MSNKAIVVTVEGAIREVDLPKDSLRFMYAELDCSTVDRFEIPLDPDALIDAWVDDDGMFTKPVNVLFTAWMGFHFELRQHLYGHVMICGFTDEGATVGLSPEWFEAIGAQLRVMRTGLLAAGLIEPMEGQS